MRRGDCRVQEEAMDFELTDEQKDIIRAARAFAEGEFPEIAQECDQKEKFPRHLWKKACELGFVGVFIKEDNGGPELGFFEHCLINEEFWRVDPGIGLSILAATFGSEMIQLFGTENQKKTLLPPLVKGEAITGAAITEPDAGSDITSVITRAIPVEGEYVINGTKSFTTNGTTAHFIQVLCLTNPEAKSRHQRHSVITIETDRGGLEATPLKNKLGIRASETAELTFSDVRVPRENLVARRGMGFISSWSFSTIRGRISVPKL
jgi:alkylation response protein AidB-like acyl-CoA dehydrogenase